MEWGKVMTDTQLKGLNTQDGNNKQINKFETGW